MCKFSQFEDNICCLGRIRGLLVLSSYKYVKRDHPERLDRRGIESNRLAPASEISSNLGWDKTTNDGKSNCFQISKGSIFNTELKKSDMTVPWEIIAISLFA